MTIRHALGSLFAFCLYCVASSSASACDDHALTQEQKHQIAELRLPVGTGCVSLEHRNAAGDTAVLSAARKGDLALLQRLVEAGADINALDPKKRDDLNIAITTRNPDLARKALSLGADPSLVTSVYDGGAVIYGSAKGAVEIVGMLIEAGAPVNRINNVGWTALLEVAILGDGSERYQKIARMLINAGADASIADRDQRKPFDHAVSRGHTELARILKQE